MLITHESLTTGSQLPSNKQRKSVSESPGESLLPVQEEEHGILQNSTEESESDEHDDDSLSKKGDKEENLPTESKISKTLSERTTRTVIILILLQLFLLPVFMEDTYDDFPNVNESLSTLETVYLTFGSSTNYEKTCEEFVEFHKKVSNYPLIKFEGPDYP